MIIVNQSVELLWVTPTPEKFLELAGRTCYKSENLITEESAGPFIAKITKLNHESVLEHASASFKLITDRGISHELVRHRIASFSQESTRYVCYGKDKHGKQITVVKPLNLDGVSHVIWYSAMEKAEKAYLDLLADGCKSEVARSVLPTCTKTELVMTANFREWKHIINLRTSTTAHPQVRELVNMIKEKLIEVAPNVFSE